MKTAVILEPVDMDRFIDEVVNRLVDRVSKIKTVEHPSTKEQIAKYLKISVGTLEKRFREGDLPTSLIHYNGGTPYYYESEFEAHLKGSGNKKVSSHLSLSTAR